MGVTRGSRDRAGTRLGWEYREASRGEERNEENQAQGVTAGGWDQGGAGEASGARSSGAEALAGASSRVWERGARVEGLTGPGVQGGVSRCCTHRMCAGSVLRQQQRQDYGQEFRQEFHQEYRRSLEREFGPAGTCPGPAVVERLRQRLQQEPALLGALQDDALALLARGLRDHPDPGLALRGLAGAFRLLELAAVNLYLFPWRREFGTIQVRP